MTKSSWLPEKLHEQIEKISRRVRYPVTLEGGAPDLRSAEDVESVRISLIRLCLANGQENPGDLFCKTSK